MHSHPLYFGTPLKIKKRRVCIFTVFFLILLTLPDQKGCLRGGEGRRDGGTEGGGGGRGDLREEPGRVGGKQNGAGVDINLDTKGLMCNSISTKWFVFLCRLFEGERAAVTACLTVVVSGWTGGSVVEPNIVCGKALEG